MIRAPRAGRLNGVLNWFKRHAVFNYTLVDQGVVSASNFLTTIILASLLGISEFGVFSLVWMPVLFLQSLQYALISAPMLSIGPQIPVEEKAAYLGAIVVHQMMFSTVSALLAGAILLAIKIILPSWGVGEIALPLTSVVFLSQWQDFIRRYFFACGRPLSSLVSDILRYATQLVAFLALFIWFDVAASLPVTLWVLAAAALVSSLPFLSHFMKLQYDRQSQRLVLPRHWGFSKWMLASTPLLWLSGNFLTIVAASILGPAAVGALKAAQNLLGVTHIFFQGLENIIPISAANKLTEGGAKGLWRYIHNLTWIGTLATIFVALIFAVKPEFWFNLFYTGEYEAYAHVVQLYSVVYVMTFLGLPPRFGLRALERTYPIFSIYVISSVLTLSLAHLVVGRWGLDGVLYGLIVLQTISVVFIWLKFNSEVDRFS